MSRTNTEYERLALQQGVNLSDGHARHSLAPGHKMIFNRAAELCEMALAQTQEEIEARFVRSFCECARESWVGLHVELSYSASCAIKIAAKVLSQQGLRVGLIEPCFDNIRHILLAENVTLSPISEEQLLDGDLSAWLGANRALWLVLPNNPTGLVLSQGRFTAIVEAAAASGTTLIVDFCFRFFSGGMARWSQYQIMRDHGVSFISIEDTGKTWGLVDTKVGATVCSPDLKGHVHRRHDELLLNVSPFHLLMITQAIEESSRQGFQMTVMPDINANREIVHGLVALGRFQHRARSCDNVPMELLGLPTGITARDFWTASRRRGVNVLPGDNYYWGTPDRGHDEFRVPLSRPADEFARAMGVADNVLQELVAAL